MFAAETFTRSQGSAAMSKVWCGKYLLFF